MRHVLANGALTYIAEYEKALGTSINQDAQEM